MNWLNLKSEVLFTPFDELHRLAPDLLAPVVLELHYGFIKPDEFLRRVDTLLAAVKQGGVCGSKTIIKH